MKMFLLVVTRKILREKSLAVLDLDNIVLDSLIMADVHNTGGTTAQLQLVHA